MDRRFLLETIKTAGKKISLAAAGMFLLLPLFVSAIVFPNPPANQQLPTPQTIINRLFYFIWPFIVGAIIILFMVAGFEFITAQGDATKIAKARQSLIWGVVGVGVIILSFSIIWIVGFF